MTEPVCYLVYDLLPLYAEDLASPPAAQVIREHLAGCDRCRNALAALQEPSPDLPSLVVEPAPEAATLAVRLKRRVLVASVCLVVFGMVLATILLFVPVSVSNSPSPNSVIIKEGVDN